MGQASTHIFHVNKNEECEQRPGHSLLFTYFDVGNLVLNVDDLTQHILIKPQ